MQTRDQAHTVCFGMVQDTYNLNAVGRRYLCDALLARCRDFGHSSEDFPSSSWCHHLGG